MLLILQKSQRVLILCLGVLLELLKIFLAKNVSLRQAILNYSRCEFIPKSMHVQQVRWVSGVVQTYSIGWSFDIVEMNFREHGWWSCWLVLSRNLRCDERNWRNGCDIERPLCCRRSGLWYMLFKHIILVNLTRIPQDDPRAQALKSFFEYRGKFPKIEDISSLDIDDRIPPVSVFFKYLSSVLSPFRWAWFVNRHSRQI